MKFPRKIHVDGYGDVTVEPSGSYTVGLDLDLLDIHLGLYASESKALRKALKAAEARLQPPLAERTYP